MNTATRPGSTRGRPKDEGKRNAILHAARRLFFARGFEAVSIDDVAKASGVARMTIYSHFDDKEAMFATVVREQAASLSTALTDLSPPHVAAGSDGRERLGTDLNTFGVALLAFLQDPETKSFNRLIDSQAKHLPELAKAFADSGPRAVLIRLADRLAAAADQGTVRIDDPRRAACQFIGLLRSIDALATLCGRTAPTGDDAIRHHVEDCVERFLRGFC